MNPSQLAPNEIKGYRIHPDQYNWTVVLVKVHGKESKNAGQEYETKLAFCKTPLSAVEYIIRTASAIETNKLQQESFNKNGIVADMDMIKLGIEKASELAIQAVKELETKLIKNGYNLSDIPKKFQSNELNDYDI